MPAKLMLLVKLWLIPNEEIIDMDPLVVVGGGLAGSEAAWQAANRGMDVTLFEMRPDVQTGAHQSSDLGELVCSNSLGSNLPDRASGLLKDELRMLESLLIDCADQCSVPAGGTLAVDRKLFSELVTDRISSHPKIEIIREEITEIPEGPTIIASGPLTSDKLARSITKLTGKGNLYFYDAISPIVEYDSINMDIAFWGSRYGKGNQDKGDYINCPFTVEEYKSFINELTQAERIQINPFEKDIDKGVAAGSAKFFEGCLPIEIQASRGPDALAFGPLRPVGLWDPQTGKRHHAVLQLRQDNLAATLFNLVGFQTNLKFTEQKRVFRLIPGLEKAQFIRYGQMHRNTFINSPMYLEETLQFQEKPGLFFAGQIMGVEGYAGNIATGLIAGINAERYTRGRDGLVLPRETMIGSLVHYATNASERDYQPMKANFGIVPPLRVKVKGKRNRAKSYAERARKALEDYIDKIQ